jgi:hydrogenase-1 operon protein HyaF
VTALSDIGLRVESPAEPPADWGNARPILHEVLHRLQSLAETAEAGLIDLSAIPFGPGDEQALLALLGRGEVEASVQALGETRVWESRFPGVWLVDHCNPEGERIAFHIEIAEIPGILRAQAEDVADSARALAYELSTWDPQERP